MMHGQSRAVVQSQVHEVSGEGAGAGLALRVMTRGQTILLLGPGGVEREWPSQINGMYHRSFVGIVHQDLPQVGNVAGRQPQGVQFGQFGVRWDPRQGGLEPGEGLAEDPHSGPFPRIGRIPLDGLIPEAS